MTGKRWWLALGALLAWTGAAQAQDDYPVRPVTVIVPQAPGGANDAVARIVMQRMSELMGRPFVIENRVGAGGNIGTAAAAKARADGYTLMLTTDSAHVVNPWLYQSAGFDPNKDFEAIAPVASAGFVLVANPSFPAKTVRELIEVAKARPGQISIASTGNHLIADMLARAAGIEFLHVTYKSAATSVTDVASGQVALAVLSVPSSLGFINSGRVKVLATVNAKRIAALPGVPTIGETVPGFGTTAWYGILAPAGTPKDIVARLHAAIQAALDSKDVRDKLAAQGCEVMKGTSAQFEALIRADLGKWGKVVRDSGATLD